MKKPVSKDQLSSRFAKYDYDHGQFERAISSAVAGCVKKHIFLPSGRVIFTVVGSNADELIDPPKSFCSCESYFYRVLGSKVPECYHILSYRIAEQSGLVAETEFDDEEYDTFMRLLASDVLHSRRLPR